MVSQVLAILLIVAAGKADPVDAARKSFNNCLIDQHNKAVELKKTSSDFDKIVKENCLTERTAYHDANVKAERGYGSNAKDAEQYANEEVQNVVSGIISSFTSNIESGAKLSPEK
jgi:hypothetical protein